MPKRALLLTVALAAVSLLPACGKSESRATDGKTESTPLTERQRGVALKAVRTLEEMSSLVKSGGDVSEYYDFVMEGGRRQLRQDVLLVLPRNGDKTSELQRALTGAFDAHMLAASSWRAINEKNYEAAKMIDEELVKSFKDFEGRKDWVQSAIQEIEGLRTNDIREAILEKLWSIANSNTEAAKAMLK